MTPLELATRNLENAQLAVSRVVNENFQLLMTCLDLGVARGCREDLREAHSEWQRASAAFYFALKSDMSAPKTSDTQPASEDVRNALQIVGNIIETGTDDSPALRDIRRLLSSAVAKLR